MMARSRSGRRPHEEGDDRVPGSFLVVVTEGHPNVVRLGGSLDSITASQLAASYAGLRGDVEIDCALLDDIDTAGFDALVDAQHAIERRGYRFAISNLPERCLQAVRLQDIDHVLHLG
jgi:anti-anti-sigma regulatory factor